jgi:hypothetical protein
MLIFFSNSVDCLNAHFKNTQSTSIVAAADLSSPTNFNFVKNNFSGDLSFAEVFSVAQKG